MVTENGKMGPNGYIPENAEHWDSLVETVNGIEMGKNPHDIPVDVLIAAGHRPRKVESVLAAIGGLGRGRKAIRAYCLTCAENKQEVRRCKIIDCPAWQYRMGKNPHNKARGKVPGSLQKKSPPPEGDEV